MSSMFANIFYISNFYILQYFKHFFPMNLCVDHTKSHQQWGNCTVKMSLCAYLLQQVTDVSLLFFTVIISHSAAWNTFKHLWESMAQMA